MRLCNLSFSDFRSLPLSNKLLNLGNHASCLHRAFEEDCAFFLEITIFRSIDSFIFNLDKETTGLIHHFLF